MLFFAFFGFSGVRVDRVGLYPVSRSITAEANVCLGVSGLVPRSGGIGFEGESFGNGGTGIFEGGTDIITGSIVGITDIISGITEGVTGIIEGVTGIISGIIEGLTGIITPVITIILESIVGSLVLNVLFDFLNLFVPFVGVSSSGNLGSFNCVVDVGPLFS